jgi:hypothetical protein
MNGKFCPVCKMENPVDAAVCIYCGASLGFGLGKDPTTTRRVASDETPFTEIAERNYIYSLTVPDQGIALYLMENTHPIAIHEEREFIIGRRPAAPKEILVDLTPFGAYEHGISHRHAMICRTEYHYEILDLESTNGTVLNGKRMLPNIHYPLPTGSRILLAKLVLYAIYKEVGAG